MKKIGNKKDQKGRVNGGLTINLFVCGSCGTLCQEGVRPGTLWRENGDTCDKCNQPC